MLFVNMRNHVLVTKIVFFRNIDALVLHAYIYSFRTNTATLIRSIFLFSELGINREVINKILERPRALFRYYSSCT
jgi:hypothetical protein